MPHFTGKQGKTLETLPYDRAVSLLLEKGANIHVKDTKERTPLHLACFRGHALIIQVLLDRGTIVAGCHSCKQEPM